MIYRRMCKATKWMFFFAMLTEFFPIYRILKSKDDTFHRVFSDD